MRILFLSPRQLLPARNGAKLREYHFLRALSGVAELTYLHFADPGVAALTLKDLPFCREVVSVAKPSAYGFGNTAMGILGRWPLPILNYTSHEMSEAVARVTSARDFDIIHLDSIHMIRYALEAAERNHSPRAIYNWHNIESEAMRRYSETGPGRARRWYAGRTATKMSALESGILHSAFGHVVCSERERAQLQTIAPAARIAVAENGVDTNYFAGAGGGSKTKRRIVFVGAMDYFPNSEAAISFANQIWPALRKTLGDLELIIVGANPGPAVLALKKQPGVTVTGIVPDVRPFYRDALAAVVPLRTGGGTRLKILEAMAAGVPVVSTPLGAEGLEVADGENILLTDPDDSDGWMNRIASLADSPERRREFAAAALKLVQTRYDWEIIGAKLRSIYQEWFESSISER